MYSLTSNGRIVVSVSPRSSHQAPDQTSMGLDEALKQLAGEAGVA
jgi:hypothetical protein